MRKEFDDYVMSALLCSIVAGILLLIICGIYSALTEKTCKVYSEMKTKHGWIMVGKVMVPTTYQGRDCVAWEK